MVFTHSILFSLMLFGMSSFHSLTHLLVQKSDKYFVLPQKSKDAGASATQSAEQPPAADAQEGRRRERAAPDEADEES